MSYFVDTNVPTGYAIPHDKWHGSSVDFIENASEPIYWSTVVKNEYQNILDSIVDDIEIFLDEIKKLLKANEKDFPNYYRFEQFIKQKTKHCSLNNIKKTKILEEFWNKNNFIEGISEEIYIKFTEFLENLSDIYVKRDSTLNNILILHDCGLDNYLKYNNYAHDLFDGGIHKPDCKIIIDAHDCGRIHDDLVFITNDEELLETIKSLDTSNLKIIEFRSCN